MTALFVLLEHDTRRRAEVVQSPPRQPLSGAAREERTVHWDLMIEVAGREALATWRLAENPLERVDPIAAVALGDHRRAYLDFEGELTGDRGRVKRLDRGDASIESSERRFIVVLAGARLRGRFELAMRRGTLHFQPAR